ncbi:MAG TPA: hypothetical protein VEX35_09520 [Allosphingosinicella sp.]|nr:hypothetical protein [Allosphingosinicella sp.]
MKALALGLALLALEQPAAGRDYVGRIYSYVRSNSDGSEAERVYVYRASRTRIEVAKMRTRCRNAAFVTAELDLVRGEATRLVAGRLRPGAGHEEFGLLTYDQTARRVDAVVTLPQGILRDSVAVPDRPWHLYDYDLASLTVTAQYRPDRRADFSFGLPLVLVGADMSDFLTYLGRADARFVRTERHGGRRAHRFQVGGPAFGARGGPIWFDAAGGHIIEARWGIPNHAEYRDFRLQLRGVSDGGARAWRRLLTRHFENCPARAE